MNPCHDCVEVDCLDCPEQREREREFEDKDNDGLYEGRKKDVLRAVKALRPWLEEEARIADELERETVDVPTGNLFTMLNICSFIESLEMYGK